MGRGEWGLAFAPAAFKLFPLLASCPSSLAFPQHFIFVILRILTRAFIDTHMLEDNTHSAAPICQTINQILWSVQFAAVAGVMLCVLHPLPLTRTSRWSCRAVVG